MPTIPSTAGVLAEIVAINSVNSSMAPGPGEAAYARYVAACGERFGAQVQFDEVLPGRPNVWLMVPATEPSTGRARRLLLDIHLDTVPLEPMSDALSARIADGCLWGRGACDTKGSMAAALVALQRLVESGTPRRGEIWLLGSVDEEYLKRGVAHAVAQGMCKGVTAALVGEPTRLQPVVAHKGAVRWRLRTVGKAAHTSRPENGNNAIYQMVEVIEALRERLEPRLALERHPLLTAPTLTVGRIEGGIGVNIVPDACTIEIDRRTLPGEDPEAILAEIDALLAGLMTRRPEVQVVREAPFLCERGLETSADEPFARAVQSACERVLGTTAEPAGVPYGTDATHLSPLGIPTVVLGPGDIAQAHSADEWVELSQVERAAEIYLAVMREQVA